MVVVVSTGGLQDEVADIARLAQGAEGCREVGIARSERHGGAVQLAVLHVHVVDAVAVAADLLYGREAKGGAVADVVVDAEGVPRQALDELS